jgi:tetratricopeptide (TPR) repeat protein
MSVNNADIEDIDALLDQAYALRDQGDYVAAAALAERVLVRNPKHTGAQGLLDECARQGQGVSNEEQLLNQARSQISAGDLSGALATLGQVSAINPNQPALNDLRQQIESQRSERGKTALRLKGGWEALSLGKPEEALSVAEEILSNAPSEQDAQRLKAATRQAFSQKAVSLIQDGSRLLQTGQYEEARSRFERALELDHESALAKDGLKQIEAKFVEEAGRARMLVRIQGAIGGERWQDAIDLIEQARREKLLDEGQLQPLEGPARNGLRRATAEEDEAAGRSAENAGQWKTARDKYLKAYQRGGQKNVLAKYEEAQGKLVLARVTFVSNSLASAQEQIANGNFVIAKGLLEEAIRAAQADEVEIPSDIQGQVDLARNQADDGLRKQDQAEKYRGQGNEAARKHDYALAIDYYESAKNLLPEPLRSPFDLRISEWRNEAVIYRTGQINALLHEAELELELDPKAVGRALAAIENLRALVPATDSNVKKVVELGTKAKRLEGLQNRVAELRSRADTAKRRFNDKHDENDLSDAVVALKEAVAIPEYKDDIMLNGSLQDVLALQGRWEDFKQAIARIRGLVPLGKYDEARHKIAEAYANPAADPDIIAEEEKKLKETMTRNVDFASNVELGQEALARGDFAAASEYATRALALRSDDQEARRLQADAEMRKKKAAELEERVRAIMDDQPDAALGLFEEAVAGQFLSIRLMQLRSDVQKKKTGWTEDVEKQKLALQARVKDELFPVRKFKEAAQELDEATKPGKPMAGDFDLLELLREARVKRSVLDTVTNLMGEADALYRQNKYEEAVAKAEQARTETNKLGDTPFLQQVNTKIAEMTKALNAANHSRQLLKEAEDAYAAGSLREAQSKLRDALDADHANAKADELLTTVTKRLEELDKAGKLERDADDVRNRDVLFAETAYEESLNLYEKLQRLEDSARIRGKLAQIKNRAAIRRKLSEAENETDRIGFLLGGGHLQKASKLLEEIRQANPVDKEDVEYYDRVRALKNKKGNTHNWGRRIATIILCLAAIGAIIATAWNQQVIKDLVIQRVYGTYTPTPTLTPTLTPTPTWTPTITPTPTPSPHRGVAVVSEWAWVYSKPNPVPEEGYRSGGVRRGQEVWIAGYCKDDSGTIWYKLTPESLTQVYNFGTGDFWLSSTYVSPDGGVVSPKLDRGSCSSTPIPTARSQPTATPSAIQIATPTTQIARSSSAFRGRIAFTSYDAGKKAYELYVINADGTGMNKVAQDASAPSFSPRGDSIVFHSWKSDQLGIAIRGSDGSIRRLTSNAADETPVWSSDGSKVAFFTKKEGQERIYIVDINDRMDGTSRKAIAVGRYPAWAPDSKRITFQGVDREGIQVMNADGSGVVTLTSHNSDSAPAWSPDSKQIAFMSNRDGNWEIYAVDVSTKRLTRWTTNPGNDRLPAWLPDGRTIAFRSDRGGKWAIWVMDVTTDSPAVFLVEANIDPVRWMEEKLATAP